MTPTVPLLALRFSSLRPWGFFSWWWMMTVEACSSPIGAASFLSNRVLSMQICTVLLRPEVSTGPQRLPEGFRLPAPHLPPDHASVGLSLLQRTTRPAPAIREWGHGGVCCSKAYGTPLTFFHHQISGHSGGEGIPDLLDSILEDFIPIAP